MTSAAPYGSRTAEVPDRFLGRRDRRSRRPRWPLDRLLEFAASEAGVPARPPPSAGDMMQIDLDTLRTAQDLDLG
ncbi:MAG: hypothetical protein AAGN46_14410, partial [Acidobacteriota bacterium]